jgi:hypothetical protein
MLPKRFYLKLGGHGPATTMEDVDLVRRIGRRRLIVLRSRAINKVPNESEHRSKVLTLLHALRFPRTLLAFIDN